MKKYTKSDIIEMAKKEKVSYVRLQFSDILGNIKAVEISVGQLPDALDNKIIFDGSSVEGFVRIKEADMSLHPDYDTWRILSFEDSSYGKVGRLICDVYTSYGKPFQGDPRYILKRQIRAMNEMGIANFDVGFEPEFFLFKLDAEGKPILDPIDDGSYFDLAPIDNAQNIRRDIALELEKMGFVIQTAHHEVAPGQEEVNFRFAHVLEACDNLQTFKQIVKVIARKHGYHATFMPKPIAGINGSGMHTNCSISDAEGTNLFYDPNDPMKLSLICRQFITGIIRHARGMACVTNPTVNSYKRLIPGFEAPCYVCWSDANRSSMIRIPASRGQGTRAELRHVDAMSNPYIALACIIAAGTEGIKTVEEKDLIPPVYDNIFSLTREQRESQGICNLPENLKDAIKEMRNDPLVFQTLGEHAFNKFLAAKNIEWDEYRCLISDWELKHYLSK